MMEQSFMTCCMCSIFDKLETDEVLQDLKKAKDEPVKEEAEKPKVGCPIGEQGPIGPQGIPGPYWERQPYQPYPAQPVPMPSQPNMPSDYADWERMIREQQERAEQRIIYDDHTWTTGTTTTIGPITGGLSGTTAGMAMPITNVGTSAVGYLTSDNTNYWSMM